MKLLIVEDEEPRGLIQLTERNQRLFNQQKQFIENASHEMQTPLAVIQSQIELLLQQAELDHRQARPSETILTQTERLDRLNQVLMMLSKIKNNQFSGRSPVRIKPLIDSILPYFEEQLDELRLSVEMRVDEAATLYAHPVLAEILLTNLLKNAFVHNLPAGYVRLEAGPQTLVLENSGAAPEQPTDVLFERFRKASPTSKP